LVRARHGQAHLRGLGRRARGRRDDPRGDGPGAHRAGAGGDVSEARRARFRQAAFVYLHVGILYESAVLVMARRGVLPDRLGPAWIWLVAGAVVVAAVFWALWSRQSAIVARVIWLIGLFRLPALIGGAFLPEPGAFLPPSFWLAALAMVLVNLWMLARAGWDL